MDSNHAEAISSYFSLLLSGVAVEDIQDDLVFSLIQFTNELGANLVPQGEWLWLKAVEIACCPAILVNAASYLSKHGKILESIELLKRAILLNPSHFPAIATLESLKSRVFDR